MSRRHSSRSGFTLIELMIVVLILSILALLGFLKQVDLRNTAMTTHVVGDIRTITVGAYNYYADNGDWPPDAGAGAMPAGLAPYLPAFDFDKPKYTLDWENFGSGGTNFIVGITITSSDTRFMQKLEQNLGTKYPYFTAGGSLTYIIIDMSGAA
ncbi:MAG TPA: prepilin-type N-terminal cleavage/methylation domain-containing protein [Gemmatimonadales bacterium]|nr:prepilin-type N-terminal cleavage/methylation domain-containing protein [Gemmatimonadales bacterium]